MRRSLFAVLAAAVLAAPAAAQAQEPPEGLVWMALRDINETWFDRDDPMNRPALVTEVPEGMIQAVDVSPDGVTDWLVDYSASGLTSVCGTGGCLKRLYVSDGEGAYRRAFDNQALELAITPDRQIEAWVHHIHCADDNRDCRYRFGWNGGEHRLEQVWANSARPMGEGAYPALDDATLAE